MFYAAYFPWGRHAVHSNTGKPARQVFGFDTRAERDTFVADTAADDPDGKDARAAVPARELSARERQAALFPLPINRRRGSL